MSTIHPSALIGKGVVLGSDVVIGPYAVLMGPLVIGDGVWIGTGTSIGAPPEIASLRQNVAWDGDLDHGGVVIGDRVVIREHVVIHQGSRRRTEVGPGSWLLNRAYLAHDVVLGPSVTVSAGVSVGGHCSIRHGVNLGMNAVVHQRRHIGALSMIGMGTTVSRDIPPFAKVYGVPPRLHGINAVGMSRAGIGSDTVERVRTAYATGSTDIAGLPDVADEFIWWSQIPDRRPVTMTQTRGLEPPR